MDTENSFHGTKILQVLQWDRHTPSPAGSADGGATMGIKADLTAQ